MILYFCQTDSGTSYNSPNGNSNESVYQLTINTIPETKVFESPDGATVLSVGRFQCQLNGMKATSCKREISESCNKKNKMCCPGLVCMRSNNPTATGGKKRKRRRRKHVYPCVMKENVVRRTRIVLADWIVSIRAAHEHM